MHDVNGVYIDPNIEDGNTDHALKRAAENLAVNLLQRWKELRTQLEDAGFEITGAEARRRIVETQP